MTASSRSFYIERIGPETTNSEVRSVFWTHIQIKYGRFEDTEHAKQAFLLTKNGRSENMFGVCY